MSHLNCDISKTYLLLKTNLVSLIKTSSSASLVNASIPLAVVRSNLSKCLLFTMNVSEFPAFALDVRERILKKRHT